MSILKLKVTQSDVGASFEMPVAIYADFDGNVVRLGHIRMIGNGTCQEAMVNLPRKPARVLLNTNYDVLSHK
jgi:hypothetical protein